MVRNLAPRRGFDYTARVMTIPDEKRAAAPEEAPQDGAERRKYPRAPLQLLIQYRFDTLEEFLAEYSVNISVGGVFIRTESPREEGSFVYLQFALRDGARLIEGLGKVVHVNPPGVEGRVPGMGIEFINLDPESVLLIEEIVASRLQRMKS
ncbi:MAG: TIGR02266 family protein [Myxococcales bacterium]|jgi:type IV pilus assembly protein PilZ